MKILIIGFAKVKYMPYLNLYLDTLNREKNDIHLVYWNRDLKDEDLSRLEGITLHEFRRYQEDDVNKLSKITSFIAFKNFAEGVLEESFDFVITLHSLCSVLLSDIIVKQYKNKYIFDYRDYTYENISAYKKKIDLLVKNSYKTFVSSDAFREYLPKETDKVLTSCNFSKKDLAENAEFADIKKGATLRISYWGLIRNEKINIEIIKKLANDSRFSLHYHGREQAVAKKLRAYAKENGINNVFFYGEYNPEDKKKFVSQTDIIHNVFDDKAMCYAVSNKFYDGVIYRKPLLCFADSYMGKMSTESKVGWAINPYDDDFADRIYELYFTMDKCSYERSCSAMVEKAVENNRVIEETLLEI